MAEREVIPEVQPWLEAICVASERQTRSATALIDDEIKRGSVVLP